MAFASFIREDPSKPRAERISYLLCDGGRQPLSMVLLRCTAEFDQPPVLVVELDILKGSPKAVDPTNERQAITRKLQFGTEVVEVRGC